MRGGLLLTGALLGLQSCKGSKVDSSVKLPPLPYKEGALEPSISKKTVKFHYGKHHAGYVDKAGELIKNTPYASMSLEEIIRNTAGLPDKTALFNNAAQAWNHDFYWNSLKPGGGKPEGVLADKIKASFRSHDKLKKELVDAALAQFGNGWVWLVLDAGALKVVKTANADTPIVYGQTPLLTIDVWEHAYYLDYQNQRAEYVKAVTDNLLNWDFASANLLKA
jgi:Fe-Mn family superoxide dismutase